MKFTHHPAGSKSHQDNHSQNGLCGQRGQSCTGYPESEIPYKNHVQHHIYACTAGERRKNDVGIPDGLHQGVSVIKEKEEGITQHDNPEIEKRRIPDFLRHLDQFHDQPASRETNQKGENDAGGNQNPGSLSGFFIRPIIFSSEISGCNDGNTGLQSDHHRIEEKDDV